RRTVRKWAPLRARLATPPASQHLETAQRSRVSALSGSATAASELETDTSTVRDDARAGRYSNGARRHHRIWRRRRQRRLIGNGVCCRRWKFDHYQLSCG